MKLLDFPPEIFGKIISYSIISRCAEGQAVGVARSLRLKLVCKTFREYIEPALFETGVLSDAFYDMDEDDGHEVFYHCGLEFHTRWKFDPHLVGTAHFWHRYLVYRIQRETDESLGRFVQLKEVAQDICKAITADYVQMLELVCWLAMKGDGVDYRDQGRDNLIHCSPQPSYNPLNFTCWSHGASDDDRHELLAIAAYLGLRPLATQLLQAGDLDPTNHGLFQAPIKLAAAAGHGELLAILQEYTPDLESLRYNSEQELQWRNCRARRLGIQGAAFRGDLSILKAAATNRQELDYGGRTFTVEEQRLQLDVHSEILGWMAYRGALSSRLGDILHVTTYTKSLQIWRYADSFRITPREYHERHAVLCRACKEGDLDLVQYMVDEYDADINGEVDHGPGQHLLIEEINDDVRGNENHGANDRFLTRFPFKGEQPISIAARAGYIDIVEFLLKRGARLNIPSTKFRSPLPLAARAGSLSIVKMLLDNGADRTYMLEVLYHAMNREHTGILELVRERGLVTDELLVKGLRTAVELGLESMVRLLWSWGARVSVPLDPPVQQDWWTKGRIKQVRNTEALLEELVAEEARDHDKEPDDQCYSVA